MNGNSKITLNAPAVQIDFRNTIEGSTNLTIEAPDGSVVFHSGEDGRALVTGGVQMQAVAKSVGFAAGLAGGAHATVTPSRESILPHGRLGGGSKLSYHKADPSDPAPVVTGDIDGTGRVMPE